MIENCDFAVVILIFVVLGPNATVPEVSGVEREPVVETFVAEKVICHGCPIPLDVNDPKLLLMTESALKELYNETELGNIHIISAFKEVVNGILYTIKVKVEHKIIQQTIMCDLEIIHKPWQEKSLETLYKNCSLSKQSLDSEVHKSEISSLDHIDHKNISHSVEGVSTSNIITGNVTETVTELSTISLLNAYSELTVNTTEETTVVVTDNVTETVTELYDQNTISLLNELAVNNTMEETTVVATDNELETPSTELQLDCLLNGLCNMETTTELYN